MGYHGFYLVYFWSDWGGVLDRGGGSKNSAYNKYKALDYQAIKKVFF